jgi:hypothetical protein
VFSVDVVVEPPQAVATATTPTARIKESLALLVISLSPLGRPVATIPMHFCKLHCIAAVNDRTGLTMPFRERVKSSALPVGPDVRRVLEFHNSWMQVPLGLTCRRAAYW